MAGEMVEKACIEEGGEMKEIFKKRLKELGYRPVFPFSWTNDVWTISEEAFRSISESEVESMMADYQ